MDTSNENPSNKWLSVKVVCSAFAVVPLALDKYTCSDILDIMKLTEWEQH